MMVLSLEGFHTFILHGIMRELVAAKIGMGRCPLIKKFVSSDADSTEANKATQSLQTSAQAYSERLI